MTSIRLLILLSFFTGFGATIAAQTQSPNSQPTIQQLQRSLTERDQVILDLVRRVEALEKQVRGPASGGVVRAAALETGAPAALPPASSVEPSAQGYDEEERAARAALDRTLISRGGLLLRPWMVEVDHSVSYYNSSSDRVRINGFSILPVLVIGDIVSERVDRNLALGSLTTRLGLPGNFQFETRFPYGLEVERVVQADNTQKTRRSLGIGDLEVALYRQIRHQRGSWPDLLAGIRWKTTTGGDPFEVGSVVPRLGNGFPAIQGSITSVKQSDPAVFFGNFSYTANLSGTKPITDPSNAAAKVQGYVEPGDTFGTTIGFAFAMNPLTSLSASYEQSYTRSTSLNGIHVPGSYLHQGTLRLGGSYMYKMGRAIDLSLGIGLTRDTPSYQFTISMPLRFSLKPTMRTITATTVTKNDKQQQEKNALSIQPTH